MCHHIPIDRVAVLSMYETEGITSMPVGYDTPATWWTDTEI
jgi:hypothetical protein